MKTTERVRMTAAVDTTGNKMTRFQERVGRCLHFATSEGNRNREEKKKESQNAKKQLPIMPLEPGSEGSLRTENGSEGSTGTRRRTLVEQSIRHREAEIEGEPDWEKEVVDGGVRETDAFPEAAFAFPELEAEHD
jgi:hypothetical protein